MREKCINTTTTRKFHLMDALGRSNIFLQIWKVKIELKVQIYISKKNLWILIYWV